MKKYLYIVLFLISLSLASNGAHLKGGYIEYEYIGPGDGPNNKKFRITVYQYLDCASTGAQIDTDIAVGFFDPITNLEKKVLVIPLTDSKIIEKQSFVCIDNPPVVCYRVDRYTIIENVPINANGLILAVERCCRIPGIDNVINSSNTGVTYTVQLNFDPDINSYIPNKSPVFSQEDTALVCANNGFTFPFKAVDPDGDSIVYRFTAGLNTPTREAKPVPPFPPPFPALQYPAGFSATQPMGPSVVINRATGIISGIAPGKAGDYVVAVAVDEYRSGVKVAETRKELHIAVGNCNIPRAILPLNIINCTDYVVRFENQSQSSSINSYYWDFGVPGIETDTSTLPTPSFTYPDTGVYKAKLVVNRAGFCPDSMTTDVSVFPGFNADFTHSGVCNFLPFQFTDQTRATYGVVNKWNWDFGVQGTDTDVSEEQNPVYTYSTINEYNVTLVAKSNKGCTDTVSKLVDVTDKPGINMNFRDTIICSRDSIMLHASGDGNFSWTPGYNIINSNTATPTVYPKVTTTYFVQLDDRDCIARDSVKVNVVDFITADAGNDTTICLGDPITLNVITQGSAYKWTPSTGLSNDAIKNPVAIITVPSVTYQVSTHLGSCRAEDFITIKTNPYPLVNAGADTIICFGETAVLHGSSNAPTVNWQPQAGVQNPASLVTNATPELSTNYVLTARFSAGCTKPISDSVLIQVIPQITVDAGRDTSMVTGQPLQLNANSNALQFIWTPSTGLSDPTVLNPILLIPPGSSTGLPEYLRYTLTTSSADGCSASDEIVVRLFKSGPTIYVPSGFTPNSDGKNDILRPVLAGMQHLEYFKVYDRYGHIIFDTKTIGAGWNGKINGQPAASGTYIYSCSAVDYAGKKATAKGSFVLIR